jgi:predicted dehydrogenase
LSQHNALQSDQHGISRNSESVHRRQVPARGGTQRVANRGPRLAVVGCGYWGAKHVRVSSEVSCGTLGLVVDPRKERLDYISAQYPFVSVSRDFDSVLTGEGIDGVIIATPISTHYALARDALKAGKHVLVEKPLTTTAAECRELVAIAEERNLVLMVGHTFEYHPAVSFIRQIIQQGRLGDIHYIDSRRLNLGLYQSDSNVLWDLAPHDLSIFFYLLNEEAQSISVWGCSHSLPGVEDVVYAKIRFANKVTAHLHVSWLDPVKVRQVTIVGSEGMLVFDDVQPSEKVRIYDKRFRPLVTGESYADFQSAYHHGDVHIPCIANSEPLKLELLDFLNAISSGERPRADSRSGLRVVELLETASQRLRDAPARMQEFNCSLLQYSDNAVGGSSLGI